MGPSAKKFSYLRTLFSPGLFSIALTFHPHTTPKGIYILISFRRVYLPTQGVTLAYFDTVAWERAKFLQCQMESKPHSHIC